MPVRNEVLPALPDCFNPPRQAACNPDQATNMSNVTPNSRQPGDNRRRRSRGGKNRNRQNDNHRGGGERGSREARSEEFRPQAPRPPRGRQPVKLSLWQKLLKAIGLYKEPARPQHKPQETKPRDQARPPKSNTRNARSSDGDSRNNDAPRPPSERQPRRNTRGGDGSTVESPRVYVGNLSYDVSEQDLQELFKGIGGVRNVEIVYNRSTHRSKGYGFVEMLHKDEAIRAVEVLHDQHFMGRKLTVSGAKSKGQDEREEREEREDRGNRESRTVSLAPLPAAAPAIDDEPAIQTIVETVTETTEAQATAETSVETPATQEEERPSEVA